MVLNTPEVLQGREFFLMVVYSRLMEIIIRERFQEKQYIGERAVLRTADGSIYTGAFKEGEIFWIRYFELKMTVRFTRVDF